MQLAALFAAPDIATTPVQSAIDWRLSSDYFAPQHNFAVQNNRRPNP
jgi:hypothetical protein